MSPLQSFTSFSNQLGVKIPVEGISKLEGLRVDVFYALQEKRRSVLKDRQKLYEIEMLIIRVAYLFRSYYDRQTVPEAIRDDILKELRPMVINKVSPVAMELLKTPGQLLVRAPDLSPAELITCFSRACTLIPFLLSITRKSAQHQLSKLTDDSPFVKQLKEEYNTLLDDYEKALKDLLAKVKRINIGNTFKDIPMLLSFLHPDFCLGAHKIIALGKKLDSVDFQAISLAKGSPILQRLKRVVVLMGLANVPQVDQATLTQNFQGMAPTQLIILREIKKAICDLSTIFEKSKETMDRIVADWTEGFSSTSIAITPLQVYAQRLCAKIQSLKQQFSNSIQFEGFPPQLTSKLCGMMDLYSHSSQFYHAKQTDIKPLWDHAHVMSRDIQILMNLAGLEMSPSDGDPRVIAAFQGDLKVIGEILKVDISYLIARINAPFGETLGVNTTSDRAFFQRHFEMMQFYTNEIVQGDTVKRISKVIAPHVRRSPTGEPLNLFGLFLDSLQGFRRLFHRMHAIYSAVQFDKEEGFLPAYMRVSHRVDQLLDGAKKTASHYERAIDFVFALFMDQFVNKFQEYGDKLQNYELVLRSTTIRRLAICRRVYLAPFLILEKFYVAKQPKKIPKAKAFHVGKPKAKRDKNSTSKALPSEQQTIKSAKRNYQPTPYEGFCNSLRSLEVAYPLEIKGESDWDRFRRWRLMVSGALRLRLRWQLIEEGKRVKGPIANWAKWVDLSLFFEAKAKLQLAHSQAYDEKLFYSHDGLKLNTVSNQIIEEQSTILRKVFWFYADPPSPPQDVQLTIPTLKSGSQPNAQVQKYMEMHHQALQGEIEWVGEVTPVKFESKDPDLTRILKQLDELKSVGADTPLFCVVRHAELQVSLLSTALKIALRRQKIDLEKKDASGRPLKYCHDVDTLWRLLRPGVDEPRLDYFRGDPRYSYARFTPLTRLIVDTEQLCHLMRKEGFLTPEERRLAKQKEWDLHALHKELARIIEQARTRTNLALRLAHDILSRSLSINLL